MSLPTRPEPARLPAGTAAAPALSIAIGYAAVAALWLFGADWLFVRLGVPAQWLGGAAAVKLTLFVAATAAGAYLLLRGRVLQRGDAAAPAGGEDSLVQAVEDSVLAHMAVLDRRGRIVTVNAAWRRFALANGAAADCGVGADYVAVCRAAAGVGHEDLHEVAAALADVLAGRRELYMHEYECHAPHMQRWFHMSVTPLRTAEGGAVVVHTDVTARHLAEDALRESVEIHRAMVSALDEGILVFDAGGFIRAGNTQAEALLGRALAELQGQRWPWRLLRADGTPLAVEELPVVRTYRSGPCRGMLLAVDVEAEQRRRWFRVNTELLHGADGASSGVVVSFTDITERYLAEQRALKLSMAVQQSPLGVIIIGLDKRIEYINEAFTRITGFAAARAVGKRREEFQPDPEPPGVIDEMRAALRAGGTWRGQLRNRRADGERYDELVHAAPIRQSDGTITHFLAVIEDATERNRLEAELEAHRHGLAALVDERTRQLQGLNRTLVEQERFVRTVADTQPGMLAYWDSELRCRFANRAYREWFGRREDEIIGMTALEVLGEERLRYVAEPLRLVLGGERHHFQRLIHGERGQSMHALVTHIPDVVDGEVRGFLVLVADVTEMKQAELRLQELNAELMASRDKAEAASRAKSAFLANMSHEIRTPMNAIIGLTHLLRRDAADPIACERLTQVSDAATHLLQVVNDVLDLSKIEAGRVDLEEADFSLDELLSRAESLIGERARDKGLALHFSASGVPDALRGDAMRISQALLNLLVNAVKFTAAGRIDVQVTLRAREAAALRVRFTVRDTGIGIPAETLPQLFQAFVQADTSTTRRFGGTGLGLAITQRLAALMGGTVGADSREGEGSEFWFEVLLRPGRRTALLVCADSDPELLLQERFTGARVLLVEDNPINQAVALELLERPALLVDVAVDGAQAVEAVMVRQYDLVLMDLQMPVMDGLEATRRMRRVPALAGTPIIAMTANAFGEDRAACIAAGMDDHVAKPVDPRALYATVLRWLQRGDGAAAAAPPAARPGPPPRETLDRLAALLEASDYEALACLREVGPTLQAHAPETAHAIEAALRGFDFERALRLLRAL